MDKNTKKQHVAHERRQFLKSSSSMALAGVSTALLPGQVLAGNELLFTSNKDKKGETFWKHIKKEFVLDKRSVYMNIGSTGSMPKEVLKQFTRDNELVAKDPYFMGNKFGGFPYVSDMREAVAPGLGAHADEIVLSRNTTDGLCSVIGGMAFEYGDVILTTHHEHVGMISPLTVAAQRSGAELVVLEIPVDRGDNSVTEDDFVNVFANAVAEYGDRVRLIAFSHITYKTGTTLPAKRLCKEVAIPNRIPTVVDGAHGIGMLALDLHDMDCDFYAGPGHKWQCGPGATGILYIRDNAKRLKEFWSDRAKPLYAINSSWGEYDSLGPGWQFQYIGNDHYPQKQALANSCMMWDAIGRDVIEERVLFLGTLCKELLAEKLPEAKIYSPNVEGLKSGLTSVNPFADQTDGDTLKRFRDRLREEYGYIIRTTDFHLHAHDPNQTHALRISTHLFTEEKEVRGLVDAMVELYHDMA